MKSKIVILTVVSVLFFCIFSVVCSAGSYKLTVEDCKYEKMETVGTSPQTTFVYYKVLFTLKNDGPDDSDELEVTIQESKEDDRERLKRYGTIPAGETVTFHFGDEDYDGTQWIVQGAAPHKVYVNYYPKLAITDPLNYTKTSFNSGNYTFNTGKTSSNGSPGFGLLIMLGALSTVAYIRRKKKKY